MARRRPALPAPRRALGLHGRDVEVDAIVGLLRRRSARCVTITGIRGIGKSRLLDEVLRIMGPQAANFVTASPRLLGHAGEIEVALGPLALARPSDDGATIRRSPATRLLADAARVDLDSVAGADLLALARVALASDGHPEVLEQLAGWLWAIAPRDLADELDAGTIELVPRDLRRRLEGERRLLRTTEREVLASIAHAEGPLDLRAVRAAMRPQRRTAIARSIASLTSAGWLTRSGPPESPRVRLPRPFRAVARADSASAARARLTAHWAARAEHLLQTAVADRNVAADLAETREELVASWDDAHARRIRSQLSLAVALSTIRGLDSARDAERIAASIAAFPDHPRRARLEIARGDALWFAGQLGEADTCFERAAHRARRANDPALVAFALIRRATLGPEMSRLDEADAHLSGALAVSRECAEPRVRILAIGIRGFLLRAREDPAGALAAFEEQAQMAAAQGDAFYLATADSSAADCHLALGEFALARARYQRSLDVMKQIDPTWARTIEGYMGLGIWGSGAFGEALPRLRRALRGAIAPRFRVIFAAASAAIHAELGESSRAARALAIAERIALEPAAASGREMVRAAGLLVAHVLGASATSRERMRAFAHEHRATSSEDERPFVRALERAARARGDRRTPRPATSDLEGRPRLARILAILEGAPKSGMDALELFRRAWPNERDVDEVVARARVRKAVSLLRELGLRGVIATREGGYVFSPT